MTKKNDRPHRVGKRKSGPPRKPSTSRHARRAARKRGEVDSNLYIDMFGKSVIGKR